MRLLHKASHELFGGTNIVRIGASLMILRHAVVLKLCFFVFAFKTMKAAKGYDISS